MRGTFRTIGGWLFAIFAGACDSSGGGTGDGGTDGASDIEEECEAITCLVDFPCWHHSYCASATQVQVCRTIWCEEACGTPCCSGGMCSTEATIDCTGDTVCWERHDPGGIRPRRTAECRPRPADPPPPPHAGGGDGDEDVEADDGGTADGSPYDVWLPPGSYEPAGGCF